MSRLFPWQQAIVKITISLLFSTYLLPFLELSSVKYLATRQSCENDFRQYFNLKKSKIYPRILKNLTISYFWLKERNPSIKFCENIILWSSHLYHEVYKFSHNFTHGNTSKWSACFLRLLVCDVLQFWDDHARMYIRGPLKPVACSKF